MRFSLVAILISTAVFAGCAGSAGENPVAPSSKSTPQTGVASNRHLWGIWDVYVSADRETVEVAPLRTAEMHLNAVNLLEVDPCTSCLKIYKIQVTGLNELSAHVTLTHPFPGLPKRTAFDVRGIFLTQADYTFPASGRKIALTDSVPRMLNPDGYTSLFNPTEFPPGDPSALGYIAGKLANGGDLSATLNPFVVYRKYAPRCVFPVDALATRTVNIYAPTGPIHFGYAVDACWQLVDNVVDPIKDFPPDANCLEAYAMSVSIAPGLQPYAGSSTPIEVEVYDHQGKDTISSVTIESPSFFNGEASLNFSKAIPDGGFLYVGALTNVLGAAHGVYPVLVKATDTQTDQNLGEVAAWQGSLVFVTAHKGWVRTWGDSYYQKARAVAVDNLGNSYVTGHFDGMVDFDPGAGVDNHTYYGGYDAFLSKFDPDGDFIWARTWGGEGVEIAYSVAIDGSGNAYITGSFRDTADFDPGAGVDIHIAHNIANDVFLSKFDSDGNFVWARTWGGISHDEGQSVAVDASGNAYVTGFFRFTADFDPGPGVDEHEHKASYNPSVFLSKFDSNGNFLWARTLEHSETEVGASVAIDVSGNPFVTGYFKSTVDFDPGAGVDDHKSNGDYDIFLSKFDPNGDFIWARTWGGPDGDAGLSVAIDGSGNEYVAGIFALTADFDPGAGVDNHTSSGDYDACLSKFDPDGNLIWARTWGGSDEDVGYSVAIDSSENAYVTGYFGDIVDFDPGPAVDNHTSKGDWDVFLSKFDPTGNIIWVSTWGGEYEDVGYGNAIDGLGNAYVVGVFSGPVDFNPGPGLFYPNSWDGLFLSKFPPDGDW